MRALANIGAEEALSRLVSRWQESAGAGNVRFRLRRWIEEFPVSSVEHLAAKRSAEAATRGP